MTIAKFTDQELAQIASMRDSARLGLIGYWEIYQKVADLFAMKGAPETDQSLLWLRGATEANAGRGSFSTLIRAYTESQMRLRGLVPTDIELQRASNEVAENFIEDLLGEVPGSTRGLVPSIERIAERDALGVGNTLFSADTEDTSYLKNSAWSGTLFFSLLRSDQTGNLCSTGASGVVDTLSDLRDVIYAFVSYEKGLLAAATRATEDVLLGSLTGQTERDLSILGPTIGSYVFGEGTREQLLSALTTGAGTGVVGNAFSLIADIGANRILDMIIGSSLGRPVPGQTTDETFAETAAAFFGQLSPQQLQAVKAEILTPEQLESRASTDVNARAALAGLSVVSVAVSPSVASRLTMYDESTGTGSITAEWIADRSRMLADLIIEGHSNNRVITGRSPSENVRYYDVASNTQVLVGAVSPDQRRQVVFGADGDDDLNGFGRADRLFGGAGNDKLEGQGGNDFLQGDDGNDILDGGSGQDKLMGGRGSDRYIFEAAFGNDIINDTDGQGLLEISGISSSQQTGRRVGENLWRSADGKITYSLSEQSAATAVLLVSISGQSDTISIVGWKNGNLGITLDSAIPVPNQVTTVDGDFEKKIVNSRYTYSSNGSYASSGVAWPGADDMLWGSSSTATDELIRGYGGNDYLNGYNGSDWLDGGDGDDLIEGGHGADTIIGGTGDDVIFGNDESRSSLPSLPNPPNLSHSHPL